MKQNFELKDKLQKKCLKLWKTNNKKGVFYLATGTGKTKLGMMAALDYKSILIVGPTIRIKEDRWKQEFKDWGNLKHYNNYVETSTYVSLSKITKQYDLVILDEAHWLNERNSKYFNVYENLPDIISLTATPPRDEERRKLLESFTPELYDYPITQAVKDGLAAPYVINIVTFPLSTDKTLDVVTKKAKYKTSEVLRYQTLTNNINRMMYSGKGDISKFMRINRKRFLDTLPSKIELIKKLRLKLKNEKTLIFTGSIKDADIVCEHSYHSKSKDDKSLQLFIKDKVKHLSCVDSLNEGEDLPSLDAAIISKITSNPRQLIQQLGRIVRIRENHIAQIYILCAIGTQEEEWLNKSAASLGKVNYIYYKEL